MSTPGQPSRSRSRLPQSSPSVQYAAVPNPGARRKQPQQYYTATPQYMPQPQPQPQHQQPPVGARSSMSIAQGVASGAVGRGYGPYSYQPSPTRDAGVYNSPRFSVSTPSSQSHSTSGRGPVIANSATTSVPQYIWEKDPDLDDALHNPDPVRDARMDRSCDIFSGRGWVNAGALSIVVLALITLFLGYPIILEFAHPQATVNGFNLGGINGSGQIPDLPGLSRIIDKDTPQSAYGRTGADGKKYNLVFSDEFNTDGRTFYPGDDPFFESVDLHYWPTGDLEWYDPSAVTTKDGKLVITMTEQWNHDLNFMSGMITSWNKLCFTTGYVEVSISMPGSPSAPGLWPGAWTMGNLGRPGYGATTEGMWPYSYDNCDRGTYPNQTAKDGTPTVVATNNDGGPLSYLPGQRTSACTCPGEDHPGPSNSFGRGVPEIDIIETQVDVSTIPFRGAVSQSYQTAPFNLNYDIDVSGTTIYDPSITTANPYQGGRFQQAISSVTYIDSANYDDQGYATYGFEWWSNPDNRPEGFITWFSNGIKSWTMNAAAIGPDSQSQISARLIPEEPMFLVFNLGLSKGFQAQDYKHLVFPSKMYIDYVRIYQRAGVKIKDGLTCNPSTRPTSDYINRHINAYTNANLTRWVDAGYSFPKNSAYDGC